MSDKKLETIREYLTLEDAGKLHGHKGPFLVIGYRIGEFVINMVKPKDEFGLNVKVYIPFKTPFSCILDGLQCSTKCTLGKKSIECIDSDEMKIVFECNEDGKTIQLWIKKEVIDEALTCENLNQFVEKLEKAPVDQFLKNIEIK